MNRIDRLFGILLLLQARRVVRAQDIARQYEISERTVYRDVSALMELGVPIASQAGEGYQLVEGFFLPPLVFTPDEATGLLLGINMLVASGNPSPALSSARTRLTAILPQRTLRQITPLVEAIAFYFQHNRFDLTLPYLAQLQSAIVEKRPALISYRNWSATETTQRVIEPFRLMYNPRAWYVMAYCRLRQTVRSFRIDRIEQLVLQPGHFSAEHAEVPQIPPHQDIVIRFAPASLPRVRENQHYGFVDEEPAGPDHMTMRYRVHQIDEMKAWVLGWGAEAEVLSPPSLRDAIRTEAEKLITLLT